MPDECRYIWQHINKGAPNCHANISSRKCFAIGYKRYNNLPIKLTKRLVVVTQHHIQVSCAILTSKKVSSNEKMKTFGSRAVSVALIIVFSDALAKGNWITGTRQLISLF